MTPKVITADHSSFTIVITTLNKSTVYDFINVVKKFLSFVENVHIIFVSDTIKVCFEKQDSKGKKFKKHNGMETFTLPQPARKNLLSY